MAVAELPRTLLEQLRENEEVNIRRFGEVGIGNPTCSFRCRRCGLYESVIFWTPEANRSGRMRFSCPAGCGTRVEYDPENDSPVQRRTHFNPAFAHWILIPIALYFIGSQTAWGRGMTNRLMTRSQQQIEYISTMLIGMTGSSSEAIGSTTSD